VLDADGNTMPIVGASYYAAVFLRDDTAAKIGIAIGTWKEDFVTRHELSAPTCTRQISDWSEKKALQQDCFPSTTCVGRNAVHVPTSTCTGAPSSGGNTSSSGGGGGGDSITSGCGSSGGGGGSEPSAPLTTLCGGESCSAAAALWDAGNVAMMETMAVRYTCDPAVDFVRGMIPHHVAAVQMCDALEKSTMLSCGTGSSGDGSDGSVDAGLVHFCAHARLEQDREVAGMRAWLADHGFEHATEPCRARSAANSTGVGSGGGDGKVGGNSASGVRCEDAIGSHPVCQFGGMCECGTADVSCEATTLATAMGTVAMKEICMKTCNLCIPKNGGGTGGVSGTGSAEGMGAGMEMQMGCGDVTCPSSRGYIAANAQMHTAMQVKLSCDHGVDFARQMIPHHASAIRMCEVLADVMAQNGTHVTNATAAGAVADGNGAYLLALCTNITRVQRAEIALLAGWLLARDNAVAAPCATCVGGAPPTQPSALCEDTLAASSFCHTLGGDLNCDCAKVRSTLFPLIAQNVSVVEAFRWTLSERLAGSHHTSTPLLGWVARQEHAAVWRLWAAIPMAPGV
jgi:uncharacterized protein (DUF305 family)